MVVSDLQKARSRSTAAISYILTQSAEYARMCTPIRVYTCSARYHLAARYSQGLSDNYVLYINAWSRRHCEEE